MINTLFIIMRYRKKEIIDEEENIFILKLFTQERWWNFCSHTSHTNMGYGKVNKKYPRKRESTEENDVCLVSVGLVGSGLCEANIFLLNESEFKFSSSQTVKDEMLNELRGTILFTENSVNSSWFLKHGFGSFSPSARRVLFKGRACSVDGLGNEQMFQNENISQIEGSTLNLV